MASVAILREMAPTTSSSETSSAETSSLGISQEEMVAIGCTKKNLTAEEAKRLSGETKDLEDSLFQKLSKLSLSDDTQLVDRGPSGVPTSYGHQGGQMFDNSAIGEFQLYGKRSANDDSCVAIKYTNNSQSHSTLNNSMQKPNDQEIPHIHVQETRCFTPASQIYNPALDISQMMSKYEVSPIIMSEHCTPNVANELLNISPNDSIQHQQTTDELCNQQILLPSTVYQDPVSPSMLSTTTASKLPMQPRQYITLQDMAQLHMQQNSQFAVSSSTEFMQPYVSALPSCVQQVGGTQPHPYDVASPSPSLQSSIPSPGSRFSPSPSQHSTVPSPGSSRSSVSSLQSSVPSPGSCLSSNPPTPSGQRPRLPSAPSDDDVAALLGNGMTEQCDSGDIQAINEAINMPQSNNTTRCTRESLNELPYAPNTQTNMNQNISTNNMMPIQHNTINVNNSCEHQRVNHLGSAGYVVPPNWSPAVVPNFVRPQATSQALYDPTVTIAQTQTLIPTAPTQIQQTTLGQFDSQIAAPVPANPPPKQEKKPRSRGQSSRSKNNAMILPKLMQPPDPPLLIALATDKWYPAHENTEALDATRSAMKEKPLSVLLAPKDADDLDENRSLHVAAFKGEDRHVLYVQAYLERLDAEGILQTVIDVQNKRFQTPLINAVIGLNPIIIRMLVSHGADPNLRGEKPLCRSGERHIHRTPLQLAVGQCVAHPQEALNCIKELLRSPKMDKEMHSTEGFSALHYATMLFNETRRKLVTFQDDLSDEYKSCASALKTAKTLIHLLLDQGFKISNKNNGEGSTPFVKILESGDVDFIIGVLQKLDSFVSRKELLQMTNRTERNSMHVALTLREPYVNITDLKRLVKVLLDHQVKHTLKDLHKQKPTNYLCKPFREEISKMLKSHQRRKPNNNSLEQP